MSRVQADTIADRLNTMSILTTRVVRGVAKAWANFNGTGTVAIRNSQNVSSLTDNATGKQTLNFTASMLASTYAVVAAAHTNTGGYTAQTNAFGESNSYAVGSVMIGSANTINGNFEDLTHVGAEIQGDLA